MDIEVNSWTKYLVFCFIFNLSSIIPIIDNGNDIRGIKSPIKAEKNVLVITNDIPPEVGVGFLCELLIEGESTKILLR